MTPVFTHLFDSLREDFGYPARLMQLLQEKPSIRVDLNAPAPCIDAASVVSWHKLGLSPDSHLECGEMMGWRTVGGHYGSFTLTRPEYAQIGRCAITANWTCDIGELQGFSNSKSRLNEFASTDAMVQVKSRDLIDTISAEKLAENLAHKQIGIIHNPTTSDFFARFLWDTRVFLMNNGGSHHLAAAKYIATRLPQKVPLCANLHAYSLDANAIASLCRDFEIFVVSDEPSICNAFGDAMRTFKATWLWHLLPAHYGDARAVLLPRNEARSMRAGAALRQYGVVDLGAYLTDLAASQPTQ